MSIDSGLFGIEGTIELIKRAIEEKKNADQTMIF